MVIIAIANHKGGVGKSATCYALGDALSSEGVSVLMVDCDPQSSLTSACGIKDTADLNLATAMERSGVNLADTLFEVKPHLDIAPAHISLSHVEISLVSRMSREAVLKKLLETVSTDYDLCLIDCPPSRGLLTANALTAADGVLIPSQPQIADIRGLNLFLEAIAEVRENTNPDLKVIGILPTFFDGRLLHHGEAIESMKAAGWPVLPYRIGRSVRVAEAAGVGQSIVSYEPSNPRAQEYIEFAGYINQWRKENQL